MTLKKKLVVSTLAASMVAASVAGLPLGSLGAVGTASAATVSSSAAVKDKVLAVYKQLTATDAVYLYNLKTEVAALSEKEFTEILLQY